jgi:hypothetical protein
MEVTNPVPLNFGARLVSSPGRFSYIVVSTLVNIVKKDA